MAVSDFDMFTLVGKPVHLPVADFSIHKGWHPAFSSFREDLLAPTALRLGALAGAGCAISFKGSCGRQQVVKSSVFR